MERTKFFKLAFITLVVCLKVYRVSSNYPDETGGYSIIVAFEDNHPEPVTDDSKELLIDNIKTTLGTFSEKLWQTSRHQFYIKSVDILIPSLWTGINSSYSINHGYDTANIRLSASADGAFAENPFTCGKPGSFIQLPTSFLNNSDSGRYGPNWKALLNLWASYRWGVYEEHGYIGDVKYPYAYKDISTGGEWQVTGCSDKPISGQYLNNESLSCSGADTLNASSTCRFIPDQSVNATTSLMHFHWIDSIENFCDETNHNKLSPNRQNYLCDHKSAWEVIRETRDFQIVTNPIDLILPPVVFKIVQHTKKPSLYILLDKGSIQGPISLANQIPRAVINFLNSEGLLDTVAAVASFPGTQEPIKDEIDWSRVGDNLDRFVDIIGDLNLNRPLQRNFPQSILAAVDKIKAKSHPNGVVMLVVKYGGDLTNFGNYPPEPEVVNALNEQGIILNSIELGITNHSGHAHLSELARETGGVYTVISNYGEAQTSLGNVIWYLNKILSEDYKELRKNYRTLLRTSITSGSITRFKVPKSSEALDNLGKVEAYFSTNDGSLTKNNFIVEGINPTNGSARVIGGVFLRKIQDWLDNGSKWTYFLQVSIAEIVSYSELTIRTLCPLCHGTMLIRTNVIDEDAENITLSIFTNVDNHTVDFRNEPIILFAKIFKSTTPVIGAQVLAYITESDVQTTSNLYLTDDGEGSPDAESFDGIYSGYFVPNRDGTYKISISVEGNKYFSLFSQSIITASTFGNTTSGKHERLLPVDQDMGCRGVDCDNTVLPDHFMQSIDFLAEFKISNTANYSPEPTKISTFIVSHDASPETLTLFWIAPTVPGKLFSVSSYDIRQSNNKEDLISNFESQQQVPGSLEITPGAPGSLEQFKVTMPTVTTFYAIRSVYKGRPSKISETQGIQIAQDPPTTTTTSSTTTSTSSSTTSTSTTASSSTTSTTMSPSSTTSSSTTTGETTETTLSSSTPPSTTTPTTPEPVEDKKPWAKTGGGIAIITIVVIIVVAAIAFAVFYVLKMRGSSTGKINPPSQQSRSSIPL